MILYAVVCGLWMVLNFWMMPWHALQVGQVSFTTCCLPSGVPVCGELGEPDGAKL